MLLAAADMIDQLRPFLLGSDEREAVHAHLGSLAEQLADRQGDGSRHVLDRRDPLGLDRAD